MKKFAISSEGWIQTIYSNTYTVMNMVKKVYGGIGDKVPIKLINRRD